MQASVRWSPPQGVLGALVTKARERAAALRADPLRLAPMESAGTGRKPSFGAALRQGADVRLIAEIKRRSPSGGVIAPGLGAAVQATAYRDGGAAAISVLTEPAEFGGSVEDLDAAEPLGLPLLRKDFIVDNVQIQEAAAHGASAVLLIVRAVPPDTLAELYAYASVIGLECLVEVHTEEELTVAIAGGYPVIGVNNRNLETLEVDQSVTGRLIPWIPPRVVAVYESGIRTRDDVERAAALGADAVLVGSALSASGDPAAAVRGLCGVARRGRRAS